MWYEDNKGICIRYDRCTYYMIWYYVTLHKGCVEVVVYKQLFYFLQGRKCVTVYYCYYRDETSGSALAPAFVTIFMFLSVLFGVMNGKHVVLVGLIPPWNSVLWLNIVEEKPVGKNERTFYIIHNNRLSSRKNMFFYLVAFFVKKSKSSSWGFNREDERDK